MCVPSSFIGGLVLPTSRYSCALTFADARLNFNLNCGSLSSPSSVPLYRPECVDTQLDAVTRRFLSHGVAFGVDGRLSLPTVFQLFPRDFGRNGTKASPAEMAQYVASQLKGQPIAQRIAEMLKQTSYLGSPIQYAPFEFRCRTLGLMSDEAAGVE